MQIELAPEVMFQYLGGESILLDMQQGYYYGLDEVGTQFWSLLAAGHDVDSAVAALLEVFEVDETTLRSDLDALLRELQTAGLIAVC